MVITVSSLILNYLRHVQEENGCRYKSRNGEYVCTKHKRVLTKGDHEGFYNCSDNKSIRLNKDMDEFIPEVNMIDRFNFYTRRR